MTEAIRLATDNVTSGRGGPFAAVVVLNGDIIARGTNLVTSTNDPTAHAEVVAIRRACEAVHSFQLHDCELYTTCEPCPMCLGAIYWARLPRLFYGSTRDDAAGAGFDDSFIYDEIGRPLSGRRIAMQNLMRAESLHVFQAWRTFQNKIAY